MKALFRSFNMFIKQIWRDNMLIAVCIAPLLAACFFRFGIPSIEGLLCRELEKAKILANYYLLFDLFLSVMTPYMFCFASSMVLLTEYDENMSQYIAATPVGKNGYLISRIIFPALISFFASVFLMLCFALTKWSFLMLLTTCALTCALSILFSLLLFSFSNNKVEGMALAKIAGLIMLGLPVPFFLFSNVQYLFSFLPSFWIAKLSFEKSYWFTIPTLLTLYLWFRVLYKMFVKKFSK